jgi:hypothetical protein
MQKVDLEAVGSNLISLNIQDGNGVKGMPGFLHPVVINLKN